MIAYSDAMKACGPARTGIAPVNLLEILDVNGNFYFFADRKKYAPSVILAAQADDIPVPDAPFAPSAGTGVAWAVPRATALSTSSGGVAFPATAKTNATGSVTRGGSSSLGDWNKGALWTDFALPSGFGLPPGAVVTGIYPVIQCSRTYVGGRLYVQAGASCTFDSVGGLDGTGVAGIASPSAPPSSASFDPTTFYGASIGTDLSALASMCIGVCNSDSSPSGTFGSSDVTTVMLVAFAIYFTSTSGSTTWPSGTTLYEPWLIGVPPITFHRSAVSDVGNFILQNLSGDTLARDMERILRSSAMEGAFFVYRSWQADVEEAWIEVHGQLTVDNVPRDSITLKALPAINPAADDTPLEEYGENCQLWYGKARCGATSGVECQYSFQTCQVVERIMVEINSFEKNYGEATSNAVSRVVNRRRRI